MSKTGTKKQIILCDTCKGEGRVFWEHIHCDELSRYEVCHTCNGSGRLIQTITHITEPFKPGNAFRNK